MKFIFICALCSVLVIFFCGLYYKCITTKEKERNRHSSDSISSEQEITSTTNSYIREHSESFHVLALHDIQDISQGDLNKNNKLGQQNNRGVLSDWKD